MTPTSNSPSPADAATRERRNSWLILAALWLLLLGLAALRPLAVPDEGRYGEVGRWMLVSGDWLTPRLDGLPFFHKPPLLHWLQAASLSIAGVSAWTLRLVPALHAGLMLSALYLAARSIAGEAVARRAAIMLGTSLGFLVAGQYINHDMLVATWIGLAIWCFAFAFMAPERPHAGLARLGFLACALGMLSKGLIGVALPGLVILVWLIWTRQFKKMLALPWISGLALFAAVALPWFVLAQRSFPNFFNYMFIGQQFNRYTASSYNNPQPWWFYLLALVLLLFPWVFFALAQARRVTADTPAVRLMDCAWWRLCWSWVLAILVFFSIPNSKLVGYILPVLPPLALLAALGWDRVMGLRASVGRWFAGLCVLNIGIALVLMLVVGRVTQTTRAQDVAQVLACAAAPEDTIYVAGGYPYDLPFYIQNRKPLVVLGDWPQWRRTAGDGWERELFEGADFDPLAGQALQPMQVLLQPAGQGQRWLVLRHNRGTPPLPPFWTRQYQGFGWDLYRDGSAPEGPEAAQHKGLPGCRDQRQK